MPHEIQFATFNVLNLALPGSRFYSNQEPYSIAQYDAKISWLAQQLDRLDADVIGLQEIFSQEALKDVLARTKNYRDAHHLGCDPLPRNGQLSPNVAMISRLPVVGKPIYHLDLPRNLSVSLPDMAQPMTQFTRPILQATLVLPGGRHLNAFVVHLKSKRPDWRQGELEDDPYQHGLATLRSLLRRGTEALGLRYLLTDHGLAGQTPLVVLGDFNDTADAVTTQIVMGSGWRGKAHFDERLYDCVRIQLHSNPLRNTGFSHVHDGAAETIDHILVSKELYRHSPQAIGEVINVRYLNEHLALRPAATSDHGQVVVRVHLYRPEEQATHESTQGASCDDVNYTASGFFGVAAASSPDSSTASAASSSSSEVSSVDSPSSPG